MPSKIDLAGKKFGRLEVLAAALSRNRHTYWACKCDCGNEVVIRTDKLTRGTTRSCGCLHKEVITKHGMCNSLIYRIWSSMLDRCTNPNAFAYSRYGGRGIKVCNQWRHDFECFYKDLGPRPSPQHSLDRIDNDGDYEPNNCRWATQKQQSRNCRSNRLITYRGKTKCLVEWAEEFNLGPSTLYGRLERGWSVQASLERKLQARATRGKLTRAQALQIRRLYAAGDVTMAALGKQFNVSKSQIGNVIREVCWR